MSNIQDLIPGDSLLGDTVYALNRSIVSNTCVIICPYHKVYMVSTQRATLDAYQCAIRDGY